MPRRARVIVPGLPHHITQRGNNHQQVFDSVGDFGVYLGLLTRHTIRCGVDLLAYCLMQNHVHLIMVPEHEKSLACALGRAHSEFALAKNRKQGCSGHLFQNRFFSCVLDNDHLVRAVRYVELNPVRAGVAAEAWQWLWSSAAVHCGIEASDGILSCGWEEHLGQWDYGEWRELLSAGGSADEDDCIRHATNTGEPLGSREFIAGLERQVGRRLRVLKRGRPKKPAQPTEDRGRQSCLFQGQD